LILHPIEAQKIRGNVTASSTSSFAINTIVRVIFIQSLINNPLSCRAAVLPQSINQLIKSIFENYNVIQKKE